MQELLQIVGEPACSVNACSVCHCDGRLSVCVCMNVCCRVTSVESLQTKLSRTPAQLIRLQMFFQKGKTH